MGIKPLNFSSGALSRISKLGLVISDPFQFRLLADADVVVFSKAGMLTRPIRKVVKTRLAYGSALAGENNVLQIAAALEHDLEHPLAESIIIEAKRKKLSRLPAEDVRVIPGLGVTGVVGGESVFVGGPGMLNTRNIPIYVDDLVRADSANQLGHTVVYVVQNSELIGLIELSEEIMPEALEVVNKLKSQKYRVALITGDATGVAQQVADALGIKEVFAEVLPNRKPEIIRKLKSTGAKVILTGKLETDALALAEANVGIALDSDATSSSTAAGLHLKIGDVKSILQTISLSRAQKFRLGMKRLIGIALVFVLLGAALILLGSR